MSSCKTHDRAFFKGLMSEVPRRANTRNTTLAAPVSAHRTRASTPRWRFDSALSLRTRCPHVNQNPLSASTSHALGLARNPPTLDNARMARRASPSRQLPSRSSPLAAFSRWWVAPAEPAVGQKWPRLAPMGQMAASHTRSKWLVHASAAGIGSMPRTPGVPRRAGKRSAATPTRLQWACRHGGSIVTSTLPEPKRLPTCPT
jgi:hypothetical protein